MVAGKIPTSRRALRLALCAIAGASLIAACADAPTEPDMGAPSEASSTAALSVTPPHVGCVPGVQGSGASYEVCFPADWNGDLVVWAHGYVNPNEPLAIPADEVNGQPISAIVTSLGYAYATTSYRKNGLVAADAVVDLEDLARIVREDFAVPRFALLVGGSEGGLSTGLALQQPGSEYDGGMPTCGPVGNFRKQLNFFGDFRVAGYFSGIPLSSLTLKPVGLEEVFAEVTAPPAPTRDRG